MLLVVLLVRTDESFGLFNPGTGADALSSSHKFHNTPAPHTFFLPPHTAMLPSTSHLWICEHK